MEVRIVKGRKSTEVQFECGTGGTGVFETETVQRR